MIEWLLWWLRVGAKLMLVIPGPTVVLVLLGLGARVSMLVSFLLPLKIIMMLGSGGEITLPLGLLSGIGHEGTVLILSGLAVAFYIGYLGSEKLIESVASGGVDRLLEQTSKVVLFDNQDQVAANAFKRYTAILSQLLYAFIAATVIAFFFPDVVWLIAASVVGVFVFVVAGTRMSARLGDYLSSHFSGFVNVISGAIFLAVFALVVSDFLWFEPPSFLVAIIGLLLSRQLLGQLSDSLVGFNQLLKQRERINVLFFSREVLNRPTVTLPGSPWGLLSREQSEKWIPSLIGNAIGQRVTVGSVKWVQAGIRGVVFLEVAVLEGDQRYLVKIFDKQRTSQAMHEAALLLGAENAIPAPVLVNASILNGYHVHLMEMNGLSNRLEMRSRKAEIRWRVALSAIEPDSSAVERYMRSKPMLWDRLDLEMFKVLELIAPDEKLPLVGFFRERFAEVKKRLRSLPPSLHNPGFSIEAVRLDNGGGIKHLHWGQWSIEPVGAGWPSGETSLRLAWERFEVERRSRESLQDVDVSDVNLASLMFDFEAQFRKDRMLECLALLERARRCFHS